MKKSIQNNTTNLIRIIIAIILSLALIGLIVGVCVGFVYNNTPLNPQNKLNVVYNGVTYKGTENAIMLPYNGTARFDVKNSNGGYTVKIYPNVTAKTDITFTENGNEHSYREQSILNAFLTKDKVHDEYFEIDCSKPFILELMLSRLYNDAKITLNGSVEYPYMIEVSDGSQTVKIAAKGYIYTGGITVDNDDVVFGDEDYSEQEQKPQEGEQDEKDYYIDFDTLGNGTLETLDIQCAGTADKGDEVTFKLSVAEEFEATLEITGLQIKNADTGEDGQYLNPKDSGEYTFLMPDFNVLIIVYIMTK